MKQQLFKVLFVCMAVAFLPQVAHAAGDIEINATNFPDSNFRNYLLQQDYGKDGKLTEGEIMEITELDIDYKWIHSLQGIEYFTALTWLDCEGNPLTTLDVSKNTALTELNCYGNQLTTLNVSKNTALTKLHCGYNQLTALDVSGCTALKWLYCIDNQLTFLDVSGCTALKWLYCSDNQLTTLNVSGCTALFWLFCSDNPLTSLDVSGCTALDDLFFFGTPLTSLDASGCIALTELKCHENQLTFLDVSGCTALKILDCSSNQLTSLDVSRNTALTGLDCSSNQIKGASMDNLINSLTHYECPIGRFYVYSFVSSNEGNVCTKEQVLDAIRKGWTAYCYGYDEYGKKHPYEYEGSDGMPSNMNDIRMEAGKDAPVYNLRGERLTAPQKGVNIIGGRKVVVK